MFIIGPFDYRMDLLRFIYKHPYTTIDGIEKHCRKPWQRFRGAHRSVGTFSRPRLCQHIDFLKDEGLIIYVPFSPSTARNDIKADQYTFSVPIDSNMGILLTLKGSTMVSERTISRWNFWFPWIVTTCIALGSFILQLCSIWGNH
mgnify:CR=1 FL=1